MSSQTTTPIWRTALTLKVMFWTGVAFAPLAAIVLLLGDTGGTIKFALILGLGSVVLIGLSVTWRRDASSVERDLVIAMSDVEADNHRLIAELRAEVRQLNRNPEPPRAVAGREPREEFGRRPARPGVEAGPPMDEERMTRRTGGHPKPRRASVDFDELGSTGPLEAQDRPEPPPMRGETYSPPRYDDRRDDRRREPSRQSAHDESELVRHTETVSVTRRETTTMRAEQESRYRSAEPESEPGVYRGRGGKAPLSEKFGKLRKPKGSRDEGPGRFDAAGEADSLLSGLHADGGSTTDWYGGGEPVEETRMVPRQRARHEEPATGAHADYDRPSRDRAEPRSGAWRTEEKSAELRMGRREARSGPEDGWQDDTGGRAAGRSGESEGRRGRHYDAPEPTRAIASYEEDPQPRWTDFDNGRMNAETPTKGGSYMDEFYGDGRR